MRKTNFMSRGEHMRGAERSKTPLLIVLSAAPAHSHAPEGERKGPIAEQWVGEVVADKHGMFLARAPQPTSPSRASRGPLPLPPR